MSAHSQLSPSQRYRWAVCPGSVREAAKVPERPSSAAAIDGTHTHTLLEICIKDKAVDAGLSLGLTLKDHEGEFVVDKARIERVDFALKYIASRVASQPRCRGHLRRECRSGIPRWS